MDISKVQKQLEAEHKALDQKFKFITELTALMKKHNQSSESLLEILSDGAPAPAKRGRKPGRPSKKAAASAPAKKKAKARKKVPARPLRKFKNPKTGEVAQSRAPQVDKTIKSWAADLKMDWRKLEI